MKTKLSILAFCTVVLLAGCGTPAQPKAVEKDSSATATQTDTSSKEKAAPAEEQKKEFKVGQIIDLEGMQMTVSKVEKSKGGDYDSPKAGNEYVIVHLEIKNNGTEKITYNPFDYKMQNSKGQVTDGAFAMVNQDTALQSGELAPGGSVEGTLIFEEPKNDKGLQLHYFNNMFNDAPSIVINL